jgi:hypothetical protein
MGEELPDGTVQGYSNICPDCKEDISVNIQGQTSHVCEKKYPYEMSDKDKREKLVIEDAKRRIAEAIKFVEERKRRES